jgi:hypothetical protein
MTDWRDVAQDDLEDLDGELCFEDPHQAAWAELPQELREVPKDEAVVALRSLVRAAAGPELKFRAGVEAPVGGGRRQRPRGLAWRRSSPRSSTREENCRFGVTVWGAVE